MPLIAPILCFDDECDHDNDRERDSDMNQALFSPLCSEIPTR